jgi:hypothetical protein
VAPCWMEVEFVPAGRAHRCLIRHARPRVESLKKNRSWGKRCKCFCLAGNGRRSGWWRADFGLQQLLYSGRQLSARSRCLLGIPPKTWHGSSCETKYSCFFSPEKETIASSYHAKLCFSKTYRAAPSYKKISFRS